MMMSDDDDIDYTTTNLRFLDIINKNKFKCFFYKLVPEIWIHFFMVNEHQQQQ
jgi:hypothetical protein